MIVRAMGRLCWPLSLIVATFFGGGHQSHAAEVRNWACYYGGQALPELAGYDLIVVDPRIQGLEDVLHDEGKTVLAYLSLGEVNPGGSLFPRVKDSPLLLRRNPAWDSWMVDVRDMRWSGMMFDEAARIRKAGFDGLFLDTLDSPVELEREDPEKFKGMREACVNLVRMLRKALPKKFALCQNRGLEIAPKTAVWLDYLCLESAFSTYDAALGEYVTVSETERQQLLPQVEAARAANPELLLLSLDYAAAPGDPLALTAVREARRHGLVPSVNTYALDTVFPSEGF